MRCHTLVLLAASGLVLSADTLSDIRNTLGRLSSQDPVKVTMDRQIWRKNGTEKKPVVTQGKASVIVEDSAAGLRITWPRPLLATANQEAIERSRNPEKTTPTRAALGGIGALNAADYVASSESLMRDLATAKVLEERQDTYNGKPARLLVLQIDPKMSAEQRKQVKELKAEGKLWVGADGVPLASWQHVSWKASKFFISFEGTNTDEKRYARVGNRLVTTYQNSEEFNKGAGDINQSKTIVNVTVQ